jgi:hypothetical protein
VVRVARLMGWTHEQAMAQPMEWVALIAADAIDEYERGRGVTPDASAPASSPRRTTETFEYILKPKE